jgi:hypothetical protein
MDIPGLTEYHHLLARGAGVWSGEEVMAPSSWAPDGTRAVGHIVARMALNGYALISDYRQEQNGEITYEGHSVTTYDPEEECYVMYWFDSLGSRTNVFLGHLDGGKLVMVGVGPDDSQMRNTSDYREDGAIRMTSEVSSDGTAWATVLEGHYLKADP